MIESQPTSNQPIAQEIQVDTPAARQVETTVTQENVTTTTQDVSESHIESSVTYNTGSDDSVPSTTSDNCYTPYVEYHEEDDPLLNNN